MKSLIGLMGFVKSLKYQMLIAIFCGTIGHLCAISIPTLGILGILTACGYYNYDINKIFILLGIFSVLRGIFAYIEQQRNHYIAFTVLANIRDKIFEILRKLAPAKLDNKNRGNLISIITADIELLEVFFAHTISPIAIAVLVSLIIAGILFTFNPILAIVSIIGHSCVGLILPIIRGRYNQDVFLNYRNKSGKLASYYLEGLRGIDEVLQMQNGENRLNSIKEQTEELENESINKAKLEGTNNALAEIAVLIFSGLMLYVASIVNSGLNNILMPLVIMMSSFGPVLAINKLTVGLGATVASAKRVSQLLKEEPEVLDVINGKTPEFSDIEIKDLKFSYDEKEILKNINLSIENEKITSVIGASGSGKSTLVKLIMRFWESEGISINEEKLNEIDTKHLRKMQSYMTQESDIFQLSIMENIRIGNLEASDLEVIEASKKASLHEFVMSLSEGYETKIGELGDTISGGEKQRIGLARAFLHKGDLLILDEPTSNLDSLNESIILKSVKEYNKATILISHRKSTLGISDKTYIIEDGRVVNSI